MKLFGPCGVSSSTPSWSLLNPFQTKNCHCVAQLTVTAMQRISTADTNAIFCALKRILAALRATIQDDIPRVQILQVKVQVSNFSSALESLQHISFIDSKYL
ncbi:hypothetical protein Mapa_009026 [Marchantia paleacea]|nr:hypothetical protein Mapa_009026 [Marchantia paleacea]